VAVPAQRSLASGFPKGVAPIDELNVDPAKVAAGAKVFTGMRCAACHTAEMKTGSGHLFAELRNQTIRPYSDLLLHDMGAGTGRQVRRRPGQGQYVAYRAAVGHRLHGESHGQREQGRLPARRPRAQPDGSHHVARWRSSQARQRFENLSKTDREALLAFLKSL
jgi:CxxC motif-containing protein (DUF1111 family)